jgi:hypothetical protein
MLSWCSCAKNKLDFSPQFFRASNCAEHVQHVRKIDANCDCAVAESEFSTIAPALYTIGMAEGVLANARCEFLRNSRIEISNLDNCSRGRR